MTQMFERAAKERFIGVVRRVRLRGFASLLISHMFIKVFGYTNVISGRSSEHYDTHLHLCCTFWLSFFEHLRPLTILE
jgi:hypothetical protein